MLCSHPLYRLPATARPFFSPSQLRDFPREKNGAYYFSADRWSALFDKDQKPLAAEIGCGQCLACRLNKARMWAVRCMLEADGADPASLAFVTLTYDDDHLPRYPFVHPGSGELLSETTLVPEDLTLFLKRFRYYCDAPDVRFFACGEYGSLTNRPHFHLLLYGLPVKWSLSLFPAGPKGHFHSLLLDKAWDKGLHDVAALEWNSAAYVARYCVKKSDAPLYRYLRTAYPDAPLPVSEFVRMSRRPGIGRKYYEVHKDDIAAIDGVVARLGDDVQIVRGIVYYDRLYDLDHKEPTEIPTRYGRDLKRVKMHRSIVGQLTHDLIDTVTDAPISERRTADSQRARKIAEKRGTI